MSAGWRLGLVLGDQLSPRQPLLATLDRGRDTLLMVEAAHEATKVWSGRPRIALFLAAMRHYAAWLREQGFALTYLGLEDHRHATIGDALAGLLAHRPPAEVLVVRPGEMGVLAELETACAAAGVPLSVLPDPHFVADEHWFHRWAQGRRSLTLEHFYRAMRRRHGILMEPGDAPAGGAWNFDRHNRRPFPRGGPGELPAPAAFPPDATTREVLRLVAARFPDHPGDLDNFDWPVTTADARRALDDFITHRLAAFGPHQDAMWTSQPWLYHSMLAAALNLHLLDPREVIEAAVAAYTDGRAPIASVEGFVRQVLGWREYVRAVYWRHMPEYAEMNALEARHPLPGLYWTGATEMRCLAAALGQTLAHGYAHHIQRLMVTGLFALLYGVEPRRVHEWYLAVYVDAVEWAELPNTLGMSQYADGGLLGSKPYAASGRYIQRMSNYCAGCRFDPGSFRGPDACPFTVLYWDFLHTHRERFAHHPRTALQWRSLERLTAADIRQVRTAAGRLRRAPP